MRRGLLILIAALLLGIATDAGATEAKVPCAKLRKAHRTLPARCTRKPPVLGTIAAAVPIPGELAFELGDIAYGAGAVWVHDSKGVARVDPGTNTVVARIASPSVDYGGIAYGGIAVADGAVFAANYNDNSVSRIDPATNSVVATIAVGQHPEGVTATADAVWVANHWGQSVTRIDPATNTVVATIHVGTIDAGECCGPQELTAGAGSIWVGIPNISSVVRINPKTNAVLATIPTNEACGDLAADDAAVWVTSSSCRGDGVTRIDPATNKVLPSPYPRSKATGVTIEGGSVWLGVNLPTQSILRIDPATSKITGFLGLPGFPAIGDFGHINLVFAAGSLWVRGPGELLRVQPNS